MIPFNLLAQLPGLLQQSPQQQQAYPGLPAPPPIPAPSGEPMQSPGHPGFMGGNKLSVIDRLLAMLPQMGQQAMSQQAANRDRFRTLSSQGPHIGQQPVPPPTPIGSLNLPPVVNLFGR